MAGPGWSPGHSPPARSCRGLRESAGRGAPAMPQAGVVGGCPSGINGVRGRWGRGTSTGILCFALALSAKPHHSISPFMTPPTLTRSCAEPRVSAPEILCSGPAPAPAWLGSLLTSPVRPVWAPLPGSGARAREPGLGLRVLASPGEPPSLPHMGAGLHFSLLFPSCLFPVGSSVNPY